MPSLILQYGIFIGTAAFTLSIFWDGGGPQSFAILAIFGAAGSRMAGAVGPLQNSWNIAISAVPQAQRMLKLTRWLNENESASVQQDFALSLSSREKFVPAIEFKDVSFSYEDSESPALTNVSFKVPKFSMLAIAGPSGSGKSTLVDLLLGMNSPDSGQILLGGQDPRGVRSEWPGILGYVPQSVYAADRSLAENIALGFDRDDVDEAQVWKALEQAQLDVLVRTWPEMLNTKMGDLGSRMSGGQQQRLGLARALYTQPSILVLDEATSALDAETEAAITSTLESLRSQMTLVVIAHRLSTVQKADSVMLLEDGSCLGAGTFNEMRERFPQFDRQAKLLGL
ncbi:MAG: ABC transporter ATP-binding protein [Actinobacteria bacterium]|nr:ABC transporter ATP-binding protein [Actinomycetota bacterium]